MGTAQTLLALGAIAGISAACGQATIEPPGETLFRRHCAACHGVDGQGQGPLAESLVKAPADLTRIRARNEGAFDMGDVMAVIDGRRLVKAHGPRDMPVWGAVFEDSAEGEPYGYYTSMLHVRSLAEYLRSIQQ